MDRSHFENDKEGYCYPNYVRAKGNNLPSNFIVPFATRIFGESNIMKVDKETIKQMISEESSRIRNEIRNEEAERHPKLDEVKAGDYIINKAMEIEGIVISLTTDPLSKTRAVTMFCTRDEVYSLNVGKTIKLKLHESWKVNNNREFK